MANRIHILDIIRGIAVLGIFVMNLPLMALPFNLNENYLYADPDKGWNYWIPLISDIIFLDKMRALFTLLFGISSVLILDTLGKKLNSLDAAEIYFRRLLWLLLFGLFHAYVLLWQGEVLFTYAILGMLLFPFVKASYKVLVAAQLICLSVLIIQPINEYRDMVELQKEYISAEINQQFDEKLAIDDEEIDNEETIKEWEEVMSEIRPGDEEIEEEIEAKTGSYLDVFEYNKEDVIEQQTAELYTTAIWDAILYMFLGIMLFRMGFFDTKVKQAVHIVVAVCGISIGLLINAWLYVSYQQSYSDPVGSLYYFIFVDVGRLPLVLGYVSLIIVLFRLKIFYRLGNLLAATGKMALTNYMMQSIIGAFILYGFGLAQYNQLSRIEIALTVLSVWIFQIIFSSIWMKYFNYGPFEWVWRSLTYWKAQLLMTVDPLPAPGQ
jgi:uncharacterized protein